MGEVVEMWREVILCGECRRVERLPFGLANMIEEESSPEDRHCLDCLDALELSGGDE